MLNRYLGNKTDLLEPILEVVGQHCDPGATVCDVFAGTLSVSLALKRQGYNVIANDINRFSLAIGEAFIQNSEIPSFPLISLMPAPREAALRDEAEAWACSLTGLPDFTFLHDEANRQRYEKILILLLYLQRLHPADFSASALRSDFFDAYTEEGRHSEFLSQRGRGGRRRFFSGDNGHRIDLILTQMRLWWRNDLLTPSLHSLLQCVLMRAVERVSNTQGTYHDFPRDVIDSRALKPLRLDAPAFDVALTGGQHLVSCGDSLDVVAGFPPHDMLYMDPPYNFRQYTSYYFIPNIICRYSEIADLDDYFQRVQFVRGQNMDDDFVSTFCKRAQFIDSLRLLVERADTRMVALSYFDGANHWSGFNVEANGIGHQHLVQFFSSDVFRPGSLQIVPVPRTNYQSYGGYKAREVMEYLFIAEKTGAGRA